MLTADDVKKIQDLRKRGYSLEKIAKALGFSRGTVTKYCGTLIPPKPAKS